MCIYADISSLIAHQMLASSPIPFISSASNAAGPLILTSNSRISGEAASLLRFQAPMGPRLPLFRTPETPHPGHCRCRSRPRAATRSPARFLTGATCAFGGTPLAFHVVGVVAVHHHIFTADGQLVHLTCLKFSRVSGVLKAERLADPSIDSAPTVGSTSPPMDLPKALPGRCL